MDIQAQRASWSDRRMLLLYVISLIPSIIIVVILASSESSTRKGCEFGASLVGLWITVAIVSSVLFLGLLYENRRSREVLGFRREVSLMLMFGAVIALTTIVLRFVGGSSSDDVMMFVWLIPMVYQSRAVLMLALRTFHIFDRRQVSEAEVPILDILGTKRGFEFFLAFAAGEFSQENPLCWAAIEGYRKATSLDAMRDIYSKYFSPTAPFPVNLSIKSVGELRSRIDKFNASTPLDQLQTVFNDCQLELQELMGNDSRRRFLTSPLYQAYVRGEKAGKYLGDSTTNGSTGSMQSSQVEENIELMDVSNQNLKREDSKLSPSMPTVPEIGSPSKNEDMNDEDVNVM